MTTGTNLSSEAPGCAAAAFAVPLLAPRHPRNGSGAGPLRRCSTGYAVTDAELTELERWLDVPDQQILAWVKRNGTGTGKISTLRYSTDCAISMARGTA